MKKPLMMSAVISVMALTASAAVIRVGESPLANYTQINDALGAAKNGDRIEVEAGTYNPVVVPDRLSKLEIVAIEWENNGDFTQPKTVIDGNGTNRCFTARKLDNRALLDLDKVVLRGFQLRNGDASYEGDGDGFESENYSGGGAYGGLIECCHIVDCKANVGGGAAFAILRNCIVNRCCAVYGGFENAGVDTPGGGIGGGAYCCQIIGSMITCCDAAYAAGGAFVRDVAVRNKWDDNLYLAFTSIIASNTVNGVLAPTNEVIDANVCLRGITRAGEMSREFLIDTGYWALSMSYDADSPDGWTLMRDFGTCRVTVGYGQRDFLGQQRVTGMAVDIGPIEFAGNDVCWNTDDEIIIPADGTEFSLEAVTNSMVNAVFFPVMDAYDSGWILSCSNEPPATFAYTVAPNNTGIDRSVEIGLRYAIGNRTYESPRRVTVRQFGQRPSASRGRALCVGVGDFAIDPETGKPCQGPLAGAANDARQFADALVKTRLCEKANTIVLTDADATRANILGTFDSIAKAVESNDTVYVYISTHGGAEDSDAMKYCFFTHECDGMVNDADLNGKFAPITAKGGKVIMVIDTCHAAAAYRDAKNAVQTRARTSYYDSDMFPKDGPVAFITAVDFYQGSLDGGQYEDRSTGGKFTTAFIDQWFRLIEGCDATDAPSLYAVYCNVLANRVGQDDAVRPIERDPQCFNKKLLMLSAAAAPGAYPDLSRSDDEVKPAVPGSVYVSCMDYTAEKMLGYVEFTLSAISKAKRSTGTVKVTAKITDPRTGKKRTIKGTGKVDEDGTVVFGDVAFSGDRVIGRLEGAVVDGTRVLTTRDPGYAGIGRYVGPWSVLLTRDSDNTKIVVSMKVSKNGKVAVKAYDSEGRSYSGSSRLMIGSVGWAAIPVQLTKRGAPSVTLECWMRGDDDTVRLSSYDLKLVIGGFCRPNAETVARQVSRLVVVEGDDENAREVSFTKPVLKLNASTGLVTGSLRIGRVAYRLYGVTGKDDAAIGFGFRKGAETLNFASR